MNAVAVPATGLLGPLSAMLSALTWAVGVSVYSKISRTRPPFMVNFSRAVAAFPIFAVLAFSGGLTSGLQAFHQAHLNHVAWLSISIIASYALGDALFLMSSQSLGVPAALAISSSYPVWSAIAGWTFKGEHLVLHQMAGLFLVVAGVIIVILSRRAPRGEAASPGGSKRFWGGVALALVVSLFWALNTFSVSKGAQGLSGDVANTIRMGAALILCPAIGFIFARKIHWPLLPLGEFKGALWVFVIEGFLGSLTYIYAFTHARLAVAAALTSLAPALSVPIALITKTEKLSWSRFSGIVMVVAGIGSLVTP